MYEKPAYSLCTLALFLTHTSRAWLRQFDRFAGSRLCHSHVHPYDNRPLLESSDSDDELDFHSKPKRSYCGNRMACQSLAISLFSLFIAWCVKIRTFSVGGFKTLRGNEEPCGSSAAGVWKLLQNVTPRLWFARSREELENLTLQWRGVYLEPINTSSTDTEYFFSCICNKIYFQKCDRALMVFVLNLYSLFISQQRQHVFLTTGL